MASMKLGGSSSVSSVKSKYVARVAQTTVDAKLQAVFDEGSAAGGDQLGGDSFDYTQSIDAVARSSNSINAPVDLSIMMPTNTVTAYLQRMQRGGLIQPFGCLLAVEAGSFRVLAYSENAPEMLEHVPQAVPSGEEYEPTLKMDIDARTLFTPSSVASLEKAAGSVSIHLFNPITVQCTSSGKLLYAIMHRIDVGLLIDFEPGVRCSDGSSSSSSSSSISTAASGLQAHKLAAKAISRMQSLPAGNMRHLFNIVVEEVSKLTGYDRVMVYKFHEDEHGEVVAEIRRSDLEPYLGLHYPATDIPQASRFLFMKNRIRMIRDCSVPPVKIIQHEDLKQPISLACSTLRAPHGCHSQYMRNMGSIASLGMAVVMNDNEETPTASKQMQKGRKLWGLVVCHHTSPRAVPFPLRSACEFVMQVFGLQINMELELSAQLREKHILRTQTLLCDMLLRDAPVGIVSQSPNIMDLVKCDGAALCYGQNVWLLGTTPTKAQIKDIADWLLEHHKDSTGFSTDSLADAGYPAAGSLGEACCGIAAAQITKKDFLFWFRSHTAKEIKWGGAKHDPDDRDDGRRMHPRSSFKAFLEVVKRRSLPWEDVEMDAIHSLQLILRGTFQEIEKSDAKTLVHTHLDELKAQGMDELSTVANEMVRLIETATAPIFAVDANGSINGWNAKTAELTGLPVGEAMGKSLAKEIVLDESTQVVEELLSLALQGEEEKNVEIKLRTFGPQESMDAVILVVNACSSRDVSENIVGVCLVGQDVTGHKVVMDKFIRIQGDYKAIVQNPNPLIPPIFGSDEFGCCTEWNPAMEKLSGWKREAVIGKILGGEIFGTELMLCQLKDEDAKTKFMVAINSSMGGQNTEKFPFAFYDREGQHVEALLNATKRTDERGAITGVFCFLHIASAELQNALNVQKISEKIARTKLKELTYIRQEIVNPLNGLAYVRTLMDNTNLSEAQKQYVETSAMCERQLRKVLDDVDLEKIEDGFMEMDTTEFVMSSVMDAVITQGMITSREKGLQLIREIPKEMKTMRFLGDPVRLQQVLADFLLNALRFTPPSEGWVAIKLAPSKRHLGSGVHAVHLEIRITHPGFGLPESLVREMYEPELWNTQEGLGLGMCQKLVKIMNGNAQYVREPGKNYFLVNLELPLVVAE